MALMVDHGSWHRCAACAHRRRQEERQPSHHRYILHPGAGTVAGTGGQGRSSYSRSRPTLRCRAPLAASSTARSPLLFLAGGFLEPGAPQRRTGLQVACGG